MITRRNFLGTAAAAAAAGCTGLAPRTSGARFALQLYSIHAIFWEKPEWCLENLRKAGFEGVEFAGWGERTAKDLRRLLSSAGMVGMGAHVNGDLALTGDALKRTLDFCAEAGFESVVTPHAKRDSEAAYRVFGRQMGLAAEAAAGYGIKVGIHTTYHHFTTRYGERTAWDAIFAEASPLLQQQIDTSNVFNTGTDVVALLRKYPGRHHSVHLKENVPSKTARLGERPTDGAPCVPWAEVMAQLKTEPVAWHVIEAEAVPDSLEPAIDSLGFIRPMAG